MSGRWEIREGDCLEAMRAMAPASVDAIVCDPPYGLEFMGKDWDKLGWQSGGGFSKPGIGDRRTVWVSFSSTSRFGAANPTCECGGRLRGKKRCECAEPRWKPIGKRRNAENEGLPDDMTGAGMGRQLSAMQDWHYNWAIEALRVAKPGGHLLAFGGTRTFHRLACAIEDAGWQIRDCLAWLYGSGFPKSLDVSKAMDKAAGAQRTRTAPLVASRGNTGRTVALNGGWQDEPWETIPATDAARQWQGWGTALKPAWEPIILARKPLCGTVAANVAAHGTGALNIDGCRIPAGRDYHDLRVTQGGANCGVPVAPSRAVPRAFEHNAAGRWPANVVLDEAAAALLDDQSGERPARAFPAHRNTSGYSGGLNQGATPHGRVPMSDTGGASRFMYCAKASRGERERGLDALEIVSVSYASWENEDREARLRVDTAASPPRVIAVSGTPDNNATAWSTFLFGSATTAPSLTATKSITATATSSITESKTLTWLARSFTNACTVAASGEEMSGGSPAPTAACSIPSLSITREPGQSLPGADLAASVTRFTIRGNAASPADHPTVKPLALMRWLCRLVTPPGGLVLDPFAGSGSTGCAAALERFRFLGIEQDAAYCEIARRRLAHWAAEAASAAREPELFDGDAA